MLVVNQVLTEELDQSHTHSSTKSSQMHSTSLSHTPLSIKSLSTSDDEPRPIF